MREIVGDMGSAKVASCAAALAVLALSLAYTVELAV
jgi:hypothetical protein